MIKKLALMSVVGMACLCAHGQKSSKQTLSVGDRMPDFAIHNIINYKTSTLNLRDLHKPVLIDFFATYCNGCIALLPFLDSLQRRFGDSVAIIVATRESDDIINHFLETNRWAKGNKLPFITSDSILHLLFPHRSIPHEVWIDQGGIVNAITISDYVTEMNLKKLVEGNPLKLPLKFDWGSGYDISMTLAENARVRENIIQSRATITGFMDNAGRNISGSVVCDDTSYKRYYYINMNPFELCKSALDYKFSANRFIINLEDSSGFMPAAQRPNDWFITHALSYEITVPATMSSPKRWRHVLQDVSTITGLDIYIEKRKVPCFVLLHSGKNMEIDPAAKGGISDRDFRRDRPIIIQNGPISSLITAINSAAPAGRRQIIIDESNYQELVDINLGILDLTDIPAIDDALFPYGFSLKETMRELEMVVVNKTFDQNN